MNDNNSSFESQRLSAADFLVLKTTFDHMLAQMEKSHPGDDRHGRYLMAEYLSDALLHYMFNDCPERTNEQTNNVKASSSTKKAEKPETSQPSRTSPRLAKTNEKKSSSAVSPRDIPVRITRRSSRNCQAANDDKGLPNDVPIVSSPTRKRKRRICEEAGCHRVPNKGHLCAKHGGAPKKRCNIPGCDKGAIQGGLCYRHGAKKKKTCSEPGCLKYSIKGGLCYTHGPQKPMCKHPGCNHRARNGGVCGTHGAKRQRCSHLECDYLAVSGGVCVRHGAVRKKIWCSQPSCQNQAVRCGVCNRHGAKDIKKCRGNRVD